jgi:DNA modification methylase
MKLFQIEEKAIDDIVIKDRARNAVGDVSSLASSIDMVGQLSPILIDSENVLIDGLHRLAALKSLGKEQIEVRVVDGVQPDDHTLIELLANMDRKEFLWHEEIELKYKLHSFWKNAADQEAKSWGYRETAKRLKCSLGGLSTDLAFAEAMKVFPDLKEQSTKSRARELYKQLGNQATAIQRMDSFDDDEKGRLLALQSGVMDTPVKNTLSKAVLEANAEAKESVDQLDAEEEEVPGNPNKIQVIYVAENYKTFLDKIPDNSVGMVELDPPYAIGFNENYGKASKIESKATDWDEKELYEFYFNYLPLIHQKMLEGSWVLCWTGKEHFVEITKAAQDIGFIVQPPGAWMKTGGSTNQPKRNMASNWEMYLLMRKGDAQFNVPSLQSAIQIKTVAGSQRIHQWEKPIDLYDHFLKALGKPGSIFLSPFAGSGNCLISAAKANMVPIGCDKSQKYIPEFYERLENYLGISADVTGI